MTFWRTVGIRMWTKWYTNCIVQVGRRGEIVHEALDGKAYIDRVLAGNPASISHMQALFLALNDPAAFEEAIRKQQFGRDCPGNIHEKFSSVYELF